MSGDAIELVGRAGDESRTTLTPVEHRSRLDSSVDEKTLAGTESVADEIKVVIDGAGIGERELEALPKDTEAGRDDASSPGRPDPPTGIKLFFLLVALVRALFTSFESRTADLEMRMRAHRCSSRSSSVSTTPSSQLRQEPSPTTSMHWATSASTARRTSSLASPVRSSSPRSILLRLTFASLAVQPLAGRAFAFFPQKWCFLVFLVIFEIGLIVAGASTSSAMLIIGRAIQGLGYSGLFVGILMICANTLPIRMQAIITSLMNVSYGTGTPPS